MKFLVVGKSSRQVEAKTDRDALLALYPDARTVFPIRAYTDNGGLTVEWNVDGEIVITTGYTSVFPNRNTF